jgi:hypothetical protein
MSESEEILLHTGLPPEEVAARLADVLNTRVVRTSTGELSVRRPAVAEPIRSIGGDVIPNPPEDDLLPGDESVYDNYDTIYSLWLSGPTDEDLLHAESSRLFDEIVAKLPWPAAHTKVSGWLYSAFSPGVGRTDYPPGTSYGAEDRHLWQPYANP